MERPVGFALKDFQVPASPGPQMMPGRYMQLERLDAQCHDAELQDALQGHDWVWDYIGVGPFADAQQLGDWISSVQSGADPYFYAIRDAATGKVAGFASYMRIEPKHGVIEIGFIVIAPCIQRTPAATEAISAMISWAFDHGYRRVEWKCDALNAPSIAAALRFGFQAEGTFRQHMIYKSRNRDTAWFAIIDRDWPDLRRAHEQWLDSTNFNAAGQQRTSLSSLTAAVRQPF